MRLGCLEKTLNLLYNSYNDPFGEACTAGFTDILNPDAIDQALARNTGRQVF